MTRKVVDPFKAAAIQELLDKDAGAPKELPAVKLSDLSIDDELARGLLAIHRLMKMINQEISAGTYDKDSVTTLKACMDMLRDLKKSEKDLLDSMSEEDLQKLHDNQKGD